MLSLAPGETAMSVPEGAQQATIAAGCFWGVEHMFRKEFKNKGLYDARVGYIGGNTDSPSYRAVCSGRTGRKSTSSFTKSILRKRVRWMLTVFVWK
jgi:peptide-methionine (S)-S-oxide reductase